MNRARYHLKRKAPTSRPTLVLNPAWRGCKLLGLLSSSYRPAALRVLVRSQTRLSVDCNFELAEEEEETSI